MSRGQIEFFKQILCLDENFLRISIQTFENYRFKFLQTPFQHLPLPDAGSPEIPALSPKGSRDNSFPFADAFEL